MRFGAHLPIAGFGGERPSASTLIGCAEAAEARGAPGGARRGFARIGSGRSPPSVPGAAPRRPHARVDPGRLRGRAHSVRRALVEVRCRDVSPEVVPGPRGAGSGDTAVDSKLGI